MKHLFALIIVLLMSNLNAQCDSMDYVLYGDFTTNTVKKPVIKLTKGDWEPPIGKIVSISKQLETKLFGSEITGWMGIASAKVVAEDNDHVTLKILEETSNIVINGKKKNQFEKGNHMKIEWRGRAYSEPHLEIDGNDTTIVGQFMCGERSGKWKWFFEDNKIESSAHYENGVYDGEYKVYKEEGYLYEMGNYENGKIEGKTTHYHPNGSVKKTTIYINNKKHGTSTRYYENGKIEYIENHKEGKICCEAKDYYENGNVKITANYNDNSKFDGDFKSYRENGSIKYKREYKNGILTGYYKGYHEKWKTIY